MRGGSFKDRWLPEWKWEYDVERAKQLMKEAGYEDGFEVTITPAIRGAPSEVEACEAVADMLGDIGITTNINRIPVGTLFDGYQARTIDGFVCHALPPYVEPVTFWSINMDPLGAYGYGYDHPYVTEKLAETLGTVRR